MKGLNLQELLKDHDWGTMQVELEGRAPETHGVPAPHCVGSPEFMKDLQETLTLAQSAKNNTTAWPDEVHAILKREFDANFTNGGPLHFPDQKNLSDWMMQFGFESWRAVSEFVDDDECIEMFVRVIRWVKRNGVKPKKDKGFLDGTGIGVYRRWCDRQFPKGEKSFDIKHKYKKPRPMMILEAILGFDCTCLGLGGRHPDHWAYIAQHANKFGEDYDQIEDNYDATELQLFMIKVVLFVGAMGRSGCLYHYIEDNVQGFKFGMAK